MKHENFDSNERCSDKILYFRQFPSRDFATDPVISTKGS